MDQYHYRLLEMGLAKVRGVRAKKFGPKMARDPPNEECMTKTLETKVSQPTSKLFERGDADLLISSHQ